MPEDGTPAVDCPMCGLETHINEDNLRIVDGDGAEQSYMTQCAGCGERFRVDDPQSKKVTRAAWEALLAAAVLVAIGLGLIAAILLMGE